MSCEHLQNLTAADFPTPETPSLCQACASAGTRAVALRQCRCGHVGCCDSSPGKHATKHFHDTQHSVMRSIMPGDKWDWCYVHAVMGQLG